MVMVLPHVRNLGAASTSSPKEARVTQAIRDVNLLPAEAEARPAVVNDKVPEDTAVRTGEDSRSELTFVDLTITRLGANTVFSFNKGGRNVQLNSGSILFRVPKGSGGAHMKTGACSVAITGTVVILEATRAGQNTLAVLAGGARISLNKYPKQSVYVRTGQVVDVPPGATRMPAPRDVDLSKVLKQHPLITDFPPLPKGDLTVGSGPGGPVVYQGKVVDPGPRPLGPIVLQPPFPRGGGGKKPPKGGGDDTGSGGQKGPKPPKKMEPAPDSDISDNATPTPPPKKKKKGKGKGNQPN